MDPDASARVRTSLAKRRARHRRHRRLLIALLVVVLVLGAGYFAADFVLRSVLQHRLETSLRDDTSARTAVVDLDSVPFLYDLLATGEVDNVRAELTDVPVDRLELAKLTVHATGVVVARSAAIHGRLAVLRVSSATVSITVDAAGLSSFLGYPVTIEPGNVAEVAFGTLQDRAALSIKTGDQLTVEAVGDQFPVVDLASLPLLSHCAFDMTSRSGSLTLSCHMSPVPMTVVHQLTRAS